MKVTKQDLKICSFLLQPKSPYYCLKSGISHNVSFILAVCYPNNEWSDNSPGINDSSGACLRMQPDAFMAQLMDALFFPANFIKARLSLWNAAASLKQDVTLCQSHYEALHTFWHYFQFYQPGILDCQGELVTHLAERRADKKPGLTSCMEQGDDIWGVLCLW